MVVPIVDLASGFVLRLALPFLDLAFQLRDYVKVIVGQLAPLLLDFAFHLHLIAFSPGHISLFGLKRAS